MELLSEETATLQAMPKLTAMGVELDTSEESFGWMEDSSPLLGEPDALRARMEEEGYLYLRNFFERDEVMEARRFVCEEMAREGTLEPGTPLMDAVLAPGRSTHFRPDLARDNAPLHSVIYGDNMMEFWASFFGEPARHFDFTWLRAVGPGHGTPTHCDIVYMGRGTRELYTAWTPLGDVPLEMGGLLMLESSHRHERLNENYGRKDVDAFCSNKVGGDFEDMGGGGNIRNGGWLSRDPFRLRRALGGRWLTSPEFRAGDLVLFSVFAVHGSLDNHTDRIRFSSDSRYQRASHPADERWIGPHPVGHGKAAKRGMIC
jgi:hypothetical protein